MFCVIKGRKYYLVIFFVLIFIEIYRGFIYGFKVVYGFENISFWFYYE